MKKGKDVSVSSLFEIQKLTWLIIERGETNEHLDVDFSTAVDQQSEVLSRQVLQSILWKHIQKTLPHGLQNNILTYTSACFSLFLAEF